MDCDKNRRLGAYYTLPYVYEAPKARRSAFQIPVQKPIIRSLNSRRFPVSWTVVRGSSWRALALNFKFHVPPPLGKNGNLRSPNGISWLCQNMSNQHHCAYHSIYKQWLIFLHPIPLQRLKLAKFHSLRIRSLSVIMTKILHLLLASVPFAFAHHTPLKARQISKSLVSDVSGIVATSWYPSWLGTTVPPESLSWGKYTSVTFAFAYVFQLTEVEHDMTLYP